MVNPHPIILESEDLHSTPLPTLLLRHKEQLKMKPLVIFKFPLFWESNPPLAEQVAFRLTTPRLFRPTLIRDVIENPSQPTTNTPNPDKKEIQNQ